MAQARNRIVNLFTGQLGYQHVSELGLDPTAEQLNQQLRAFCTSPTRHPDDLVAVYIAAHGEVLEDGDHVLLTSDADPEDIDDALPTVTLARKMLRGTRVRRLLLLLDTCYSGQGGSELVVSALTGMKRLWGMQSGSGFVVVTSAQPHQQADAGAFPWLMEQAITSLATAGHGPPTLSLSAVVQQMNDHPDRPGHQHIGWDGIGLTGTLPPFLANPRHDVRLTEVDLALQQRIEWEQQADRREVEYRTRLRVRAMGHSDAGRMDWWFSGRHQALADITRWLTAVTSQPDVQPQGWFSRPALAVTAAPGSGKSAVLGLIAAVTDSDRRPTVPLDGMGLPSRVIPPEGVIDVSVYAQNLTNAQVLQGISAAACVRAATVSELLDALPVRSRPFTVLIDALDEAATPDTLCSNLLLPLIEHHQGRIRLLLGTRPHLLSRLGLVREEQIDLDSDLYADPEALGLYTIRNLIEAHPSSPYLTCSRRLRQAIANEIATAASRSFLVARITAGTLAAATGVPDPTDADWRASLPKLPGEAMHQDLTERLGHDADRAAHLLRPLAFAEGQGLPWEDLWAPLASAISECAYTDEDLLWLRLQAGAYIVEAMEAGRSAYRLYHQALAEHLREDCDSAAVHAAFTRTLLTRIPISPDGTRDWSRAHPYTLRYLASHARNAGLLDELVMDPEYLVNACPDGLVPHLAALKSGPPRVPAAVYAMGIGALRDADVAERRQILALDAARYNSPSLLTALNDRAADHAWIPVAATGSSLSPALRNILTGHAEKVTTVACTDLDGRPVAVTGSNDHTVRVWDLTTGRSVGQPLSGHTSWVTAVACTELDGRPIAVTGSDDKSLRVWDLSSNRAFGPPLTHEQDVLGVYGVTAVACSERNGRRIVVASYGELMWVWDLATRQPIMGPFGSHNSDVSALACSRVEDRPVVVVCSDDNRTWVLDLTTGLSVGQPLTGHNSKVTGVACTELDGRPVAVTGSLDRTVRLWDLATRRPVGEPLTGHAEGVSTVTCADFFGRPVAVTASDSQVRVWDLTAMRPIGQPLSGHTSWVTAVACTEVDGWPVAVTGSNDHTMRVWDLTPMRPIGQPLTGHDHYVTAMACTNLDGRPVAVTASAWDPTLQVWELTTMRPTGQLTVTGHDNYIGAVACTHLDGWPVAVTSSNDHTMRVWELTTMRPTGQPLSGLDHHVTAVACTELDGRPVAVTGSIYDSTVRLWDLTTMRPIGQLTLTRLVTAVACTELDGRPVAVIGSIHDPTVRLWDLTTMRLTGQLTLTGDVTDLACTHLDGQPFVITVSNDWSGLRLWDLRRRKERGKVRLPARPSSVAVTGDGLIVASFEKDIAVFRRSLPILESG
ncbi:WD40 repeat domain-containing protein [Streptomyces indiaensis]|nr:WD40 repeat domain-containing protein [Streptomyces indiaensis]